MDSFILMNYVLFEYIINTFIQLHMCNPNKAARRKNPSSRAYELHKFELNKVKNKWNLMLFLYNIFQQNSTWDRQAALFKGGHKFKGRQRDLLFVCTFFCLALC